MIVVTLNFVVAFQCFTQFLAVFSGEAVNDAAFTLEPSIQHRHQVFFNIFDVFLISNFVAEVRSIETALEVKDLLCDA